MEKMKTFCKKKPQTMVPSSKVWSVCLQMLTQRSFQSNGSPKISKLLPDPRSPPPPTDLGRGLGARGGGGLGLRAVMMGLVLGLGPGNTPGVHIHGHQ